MWNVLSTAIAVTLISASAGPAVERPRGHDAIAPALDAITSVQRTSDPLAASPCAVESTEVAVAFEHVVGGQASTTVALCTPLSLDGATMLAVETLLAQVATSGGAHEFQTRVEFLENGTVVATTPPLSSSQTGSLTSTRDYMLIAEMVPTTAVIDAIRVVSTIVTGSPTVSYRGSSTGDRLRLHLVRGTIDSDSPATCHHLRSLAGTPPLSLSGVGISDWRTVDFDSAIPVDGLSLVLTRQFGVNVTAPATFAVEAQLLLDDEDLLPLANWPVGIGPGAPTDAEVWSRVVRRDLGLPICADLADRSIVGMRWRIHKTGTGSVSLSTGPNSGVWFLRGPCLLAGDLNGDGVVDGADLGLLLTAWGACPSIGGCLADLNGDCIVDGADLGLLLGAWTLP